ncbi:MAG: UvrB/UvrC motif-containing protein [Planctomycetia bacterium]|nr:UvrB/UvrC motif-containing protein [Planctomycetia bacterium]
MKCQKCNRPATFHITELLGGKPQELHLCAEHAQEYLNETQESSPVASNMATALAHHMAQQMALTKASQELSQMDEIICPTCGITFFEFRNQSRLGCPDDYQVFQKQMEPLLMNIHGELKHIGKVPKRSGNFSASCTRLIRLRREMADAVQEENYEQASVLRDQIREIEREAAPQ